MSPQAPVDNIISSDEDDFDPSWLNTVSHSTYQQILEECRPFYALDSGAAPTDFAYSPTGPIVFHIPPRLEDSFSEKENESYKKPVVHKASISLKVSSDECCRGRMARAALT